MSAATVDTAAVPEDYVFASRRHPGSAHPALVYGRALTGPVTFTMLLVMITATASMLLGIDPLGWVVIAAPAALAVAALYAAHTMRSTPAELVLLGDRAVVRSVWDVATRQTPEPGLLLPPRRVQAGLDVAVGEDVLTLTPDDWPDLKGIEEAANALVPPVRGDTW